MSTIYLARQHLVFVVAVLVGAAGCDSMDVQPPEIAKPLGYETVDVALASCATPLPPVRDNGQCGATQIGKSIDVNDVCQLLVALKDWVASGPKDAPSVRPDDWTRVRAVCVSRSVWAPSSHEEKRFPYRSSLRLEADVPNRSQRMFVQMSESRSLEFFVSRREGRTGHRLFEQ